MSIALWTAALVRVLVAVAIVLALHFIAFYAFQVMVRRDGRPLADSLLKVARRPSRAAAALIAVLLVWPILRLPAGAAGTVQQALSILVIWTVAWILIALARALEQLTDARYDSSVKDNLVARKMRTRVNVVSRILMAIIVIVAFATSLMTFPEVRTLGASLLASAGLIGLVAGLAAQPVLTNLIAGLQIALTQPIRIDDVVIVDNQWGWIEEIDITYVVVRIWDLRRLIVPLSYFLQQPFQNWTYKNSDLLGYVHIYADYRVPVETVRGELERILRATPLWDGKVWNLQVTSSEPYGLQMRALFSAPDSSTRWNLMVLVREQLISFIQRNFPDCLPRTRVDLAPPPAARG